MIVVVMIVVMAVLGVLRARKLGGDRADQWMYGAGFGLAGLTLGMILSVILDVLF